MQAAVEYLTLRKHYPDAVEGVPIRVSMEDLAKLLYCTPRNAKLIIAKLARNGWIEFVPGRGRGNLSSLAFFVSAEEVLFEQATLLVQSGDFHRAMDLVKAYGDGVTTKNRLMDWLAGYFGYVSESGEIQPSEVLRFPIYRKLHTFDPVYAYFSLDAHMVTQIYDSLVRYDAGSNTLAPHLAHAWEANADATRWVFTLQKGIRFHNGTEVTAEEAAWSLQRLWKAEPASSQAWLLQDVKSIEALDAYTLAIELLRPNHLFPRMLSYPAASIAGRQTVEGNGVDTWPIGSGPFQAVKKTEDYCVLEAIRPHFAGSAHLDRIEIVNVAAYTDDLGFLQEQRVAVNTDEPPYRRSTSWTETNSMHSGSKLMTFNQFKPGPLQDVRLREAIHRLLDRRQLVDDLRGTRLYPSTGFHINGTPSPADSEYDRQKGLELLQQSTYKGETLYLYVYERHAPDAYWIQQQLATHGIQLEVQIVAWSELLRPEQMQTADFIVYEANLSDPHISLLEALQSPFSFIRNHLGSDVLHELHMRIGQYLSEPAEEVRQEMLEQMEKRLKETYSISFLALLQVEPSFHPSLQGVRLTPHGWVSFRDLWYKSDGAVKFLTT